MGVFFRCTSLISSRTRTNDSRMGREVNRALHDTFFVVSLVIFNVSVCESAYSAFSTTTKCLSQSNKTGVDTFVLSLVLY